MAEAYWDLEYALQQQGFDYCYDKRLYDRLAHEGAESVRGHLTADIGYQERLVRFIENHDEPRAAATFPPGEGARGGGRDAGADRRAARARGAARRAEACSLPVFLARRPDEEPDTDLRAFYERLLGGLRDAVFRSGEWQLGERSGWEGNDTWQNLVVWGWRDDGPRKLVVVNLGDAPAPRARLAAVGRPARPRWRLADALSDAVYERSGDDLRDGLYVALDPWGSNLFDLTACWELIRDAERRRPPSTRASPRRPAAPRTISSTRTPGTSGART